MLTPMERLTPKFLIESDEASYDRRTKTELLEMLNRLSEHPTVFIVGATNRPWDMDTAFLSRFQRKVYFGELAPDAHTML